MNCMKCGKETAEGQVFCDECLSRMADYPVKPGTPVHIPAQPQHPVPKKTSRRARAVEPEEQIRRLKRLVTWLTVTLLVVLLAWCATAGMAIHMMRKQDKTPIGQNYGVSTSSSGTVGN